MRFLQSSIFFMLLLVVPQLSAQSWEVSGRVLNNRDGKAIDFVNVYVDETPYGTYTNQNGEFLLVLKPLNEEIKLVFTHLGYKKKIVRIAPSDFNGGKWSGTVRMESNQIDISTVPIYSTRIPPDTICGFESSNVGDYAFIDDYTLLLLYEKEKRWKRQDEVDQTIYSGCSLVLLDELSGGKVCLFLTVHLLSVN